MKLKQLKITNYFVKNIKKNNKMKNNKLYQIIKKIKKINYENNFKKTTVYNGKGIMLGGSISKSTTKFPFKSTKPKSPLLLCFAGIEIS